MGSPITIHSFDIIQYKGANIASINNGFAYVIMADTTYPSKELCFLRCVQNNKKYKYMLNGYKNGLLYINQEVIRTPQELDSIVGSKLLNM
jgi:hypothetical protein